MEINVLLEKKKCFENSGNQYFDVTAKYLTEIEEMVQTVELGDISTNNDFDNKAKKYLDFVEAYRLARYQFSRYSEVRKSSVECVYATIMLELLKQKKNCINDDLSIMDVGCGPSRLGLELSGMFKNAKVDLFDFSEDVTKAVDKKYDMIVASHSINLFIDPQKTIEQLVSCLKPDGVMVMADLFGWKEDREKERRVFYDGESFGRYMKELDTVEVIDVFRVGPYCEEVNAERIDSYVSHIVVLEKKLKE